jgi:type IV pilus assembly protein PilW
LSAELPRQRGKCSIEPVLSRSVRHGGTGLVEVMVGLAIGMLALVAIYRVYTVSESQKRTITGGSDAQQSASYALYVLVRGLASAGNGIASAAREASGRAALDGCAMLRPIPVLIAAGAKASDPDAVTVLFGGSGSLSTPVPMAGDATVGSLAAAEPYRVAVPAGFSAGDVVVAVEGINCTVSMIDPGGVAVSESGLATLTHTPISGAVGVDYRAGMAVLVNLGPAASLGRIRHSVDVATRSLRTQQQLPTADPVNPVVGDIVNLKAQYGLDTDGDGSVDTWQTATGNVWSAAALPTQPLATLRQIQAARIAIVARSSQYEREPVTPGPLLLLDGAISIALTADQQRYRYRVLETIVPLRNAIWSAS